jgi:hypothetical protein
VAHLKRIIGIKATKATARHSVHGLAAKAQRRPLRSASLVGVGFAIGLGAGVAAGRGMAHDDQG